MYYEVLAVHDNAAEVQVSMILLSFGNHDCIANHRMGLYDKPQDKGRPSSVMHHDDTSFQD